MSHTHTDLLYHFVFSTKDRIPYLNADFRVRLHPYLGGIIRGNGGVPILVNGTSDHVHILARLRQDKAISDVMRDVKANSSKWLKEEIPQFSWQPGYGIFTVSHSQMERVRAYVANQERHHHRESFGEEYEKLLKLHEIEFQTNFVMK